MCTYSPTIKYKIITMVIILLFIYAYTNIQTAHIINDKYKLYY